MIDDIRSIHCETIKSTYIPMVVEKTKNGEKAYDIYSRLLKDNIVFITGEIETGMSEIIVAQLLYLESVSPEKEINIYINSPGGEITAGMAIVDTMHYIKNPISTICMGMCASMGAYILSQGDKGRRFILPKAEVMIHQPLGGSRGQATDIEISARHILKLKELISKDLSEACGQPLDKIKRDCERDYWMDSNEALEYGIIDKVINKKTI